MEGIGSEVSHKIRAAIKAKLIELGAYVDDELPDYIMVMVANKRTRSQMDEDLQLFLTTNTKIFTSWLHTVLQKLQEVTVASYEGKKDSDVKKSKHKKEHESDARSRKSSEEIVGKTKKHGKKHREGKKSKKNKHKSKEKKLKGEKKDEKKNKSGKEKIEVKASQEKDKNKKLQLNDVVGKAILGDLKKNKKLKSDKDDSSSQSSSSSENSSELKEKQTKENGKENSKQGTVYEEDDVLNIKADIESKGKDVVDRQASKNELIEDEFNIEPLKPAEKTSELESSRDILERTDPEKLPDSEAPMETTISAPTEELLKKHNKLQNQKLKGEEKEKKHVDSESDDSLSPEEMRKQLLLSRAKKKLEESKLANRVRSNSPDVLILQESRQEEKLGSGPEKPDTRTSRSPRSHDRSKKSRSGSPNRRPRKLSQSYSSDRSHSEGSPPSKKGNLDYKSKSTVKYDEDCQRSSSRPIRNTSAERESGNKKSGYSEERKKNIIKISESLELEKNLGLKKETDKKLREKETSSKRRPVSSRVVTITGPEAPEIPSIVKVKPREYISKDKQANKALILKAVADAEKSIATVHTRTESELEPKKSDGLFTKNLRGKRYEKLAVTLSNIRKSPDSRDRLDRRVSVDSEKSERSRLKHDSSDISGGAKVRSEFSKKLSKSEDQFISSKTSIMEKNEKYIRCWLEGVEKAVKDDVMVNPSEMENFTHSNYTDEENDRVDEISKKDEDRKRKRSSLEENFEDPVSKNQKTGKERDNSKTMSNLTGEEPQIVVTLDGLNSKTIKDIMSRNKETNVKPILSSGKRLEEKEKYKSGLGRISDRFGRLNKANEDDGRRDNKSSKNPSTDKDKKEKVSTESKNRQLIAQLSEKFGKVDREFENKKRRRPDEDRRYSYDARRSDKDGDRNGKYRRSDRRSIRDGNFGFYRRS